MVHALSQPPRTRHSPRHRRRSTRRCPACLLCHPCSSRRATAGPRRRRHSRLAPQQRCRQKARWPPWPQQRCPASAPINLRLRHQHCVHSLQLQLHQHQHPPLVSALPPPPPQQQGPPLAPARPAGTLAALRRAHAAAALCVSGHCCRRWQTSSTPSVRLGSSCCQACQIGTGAGLGRRASAAAGAAALQAAMQAADLAPPAALAPLAVHRSMRPCSRSSSSSSSRSSSCRPCHRSISSSAPPAR